MKDDLNSKLPNEGLPILSGNLDSKISNDVDSLGEHCEVVDSDSKQTTKPRHSSLRRKINDLEDIPKTGSYVSRPKKE